MLRHTGRNRNTGTRYVIVFMQLPGTNDALVVQSDTVPAQMHDFFMSAITSKEAQATTELHQYLSRVRAPDGRIMLEALHQDRLLHKLPIDVIEMTPTPAVSMPLKEVLATIKTINDPTMTFEQKKAEEEKALTERFNPHKTNLTQAEKTEAEQTAKNILAEANLLITEANKKTELAYRIAPHLKKEFKVDVGDLSVEKAAEFVENFKSEVIDKQG